MAGKQWDRTDLGVISLTENEVNVTRHYLLGGNAKDTAAVYGISDRRVRQLFEAAQRKTGLSRASLTMLLVGDQRRRRASVTEDGQLVMAL